MKETLSKQSTSSNARLVSQWRMHRQWTQQMPMPERPMQQIKAPQMSMTNATLNANAQGAKDTSKTPPMSEWLVQRKVIMQVKYLLEREKTKTTTKWSKKNNNGNIDRTTADYTIIMNKHKNSLIQPFN